MADTGGSVVSLIDAKRRGGALTDRQMAALVAAYTRGAVPDYQMAAFLMAAVLNGLTDAETASMTDAMMRSGDLMSWTDMPGPVVDKHSTGGVADTTTLVLAPILAACGACVAKLSGRGLGHTGGTIDKLESIPGMRTDLAPEEIATQVRRVRVAVAGQTARLAPADGLIYALRDVTATVQSPALIAASVMAKKLAGGAGTILLDVKVGSGALAETDAEARALAERMISLGGSAGRKVAAVLTSMDQPLGDAVGNAMEVEAAVAVLRGGGSAPLRDLCVALAGRLLALCGVSDSASDGGDRAARSLADGTALEAFARWVEAQGGDPRTADAPEAVLPRARVRETATSPSTGYVTAVDARAVGEAARLLGAGRAKKEDRIDPAAGVKLAVRIGDRVSAGDALAELRAADTAVIGAARRRLMEGVTVSERRTEPRPLIRSTLGMAAGRGR